MRELTQEQQDFLLQLNSPEWREEARLMQEAEEAKRAALHAEYEKHWAAQMAAWDAQDRKLREDLQPLLDALRAAGIKLSLGSYEGLWGSYQLGNGPVVDIGDVGDFDTFRGEDD